MISEQDCLELIRNMNKARQAVGQYVDETNELTMQVDFDEFMALGRMFQTFSITDFTKAMTLAVQKKREQMNDGMDPKRIQINPSDLKPHCHTMILAKRTQEQAAPQLEAPKPKGLPEDESFFTEVFPTMWSNYLKYGRSCLIPIWRKEVSPNLWQIKEMSARLSADANFNEQLKDNARRLVSNMTIDDLMVAQKTAGCSEWLLLHEQGMDYNNEQARQRLTERIARHNSTKPTSIDFDVEASFKRNKMVAVVLSFGYLYHTPQKTK